MPTLRIPFPENDAASVVTLHGDRISIGRLPDNAIQLRDRTVSAHHAELVAEGDHYRLHDLGSTNGISVDGQPVADFHLRQPCKVSFGTLECEFSPEEAASGSTKEVVLTRAEADALLREKGELIQQLALAREQIERLREAHQADAGATVPQADFDRLTEELAALKELLASRERDFARLTGDLAVLRRDRDNLLQAQNGRPTASTPPAALEPAPASTEPPTKLLNPAVAATTAPTAPSLPKPTGLPRPASLPLPSALVKAKAAAPAGESAAAPAAPAAPVAPSTPSLPKPARLVGAVPAPANGKSTTPMRPFPAAPGGNPNAPKAVPVVRKATPASPAVAGPKGTQKIG